MSDNNKNLVKDFNMINNSMDKMWDMWLVSLGSLSWTQDQIEDMTRRQLDQNKSAREELLKLVEDLSKQMRRNQEQFHKMVQETVMNTYQHINYTNQSLISDLTKKADELVKTVKKVQSAVQNEQPLVAVG
jgi:polyhydroxyalkanoate synthesis regulator phasin